MLEVTMGLRIIRLGILVGVGGAVVSGTGAAAQDDPLASHVYIRHVAEYWDGTPSRSGLMILARGSLNSRPRPIRVLAC